MEKNLFMISMDNMGCVYSTSMMRTTDDHIPENRSDSLMKEIDAKEQWVAWSSGSAPGLLPM